MGEHQKRQRAGALQNAGALLGGATRSDASEEKAGSAVIRFGAAPVGLTVPWLWLCPGQPARVPADNAWGGRGTPATVARSERSALAFSYTA